MGRKWRSDAERQAFYLAKKVDEAVRDHNMIHDGDRIIVGVSGGKDSMSLLRLLIHRLAYSAEKYEIVAAHVRGDARGPGPEPTNSLAEWVKAEGVPFHAVDLIIPDGEPLPMDCERCSRTRRRTLFEVADDLGCNKIALGHNLEDFAATAIMNLLSSGRLETMEFSRVYFRGRFAVIRPLAYIREKDIVRFAKACEFPVLESGCPLASTSRRATARRLIRTVSHDFRHAAENIVRASVG